MMLSYEEVCSCTASIKIEGQMPVYDYIAAWREGHVHEMPPIGTEITESSSSHERSIDESSFENRAPIGFARV